MYNQEEQTELNPTKRFVENLRLIISDDDVLKKLIISEFDEAIKKHGPRSGLEYLITCKRGQFFGSMILDPKHNEVSKHTTIINVWQHEQKTVLTNSIKYMQRIIAYMPQVALQIK